MADYLNLRLRWIDGTELGGCSYIALVEHAAAAIAAGKCSVALITLAGGPQHRPSVATGTAPRIAA
jgi:acetyl-CoA C-acetyltransferase